MKETSYPKAKCGLCGGTNIGIRNFYKNQGPETIGFAAEEYCKDCNVALGDEKVILEDREHMKRIAEKLRLSPTTLEEKTE